jgi:hypothetical protein
MESSCTPGYQEQMQPINNNAYVVGSIRMIIDATEERG